MTEAIVAQFKAKYESLAGVVHLVDGVDAMAATVLEVLKDSKAERVALADLPDELMSVLETEIREAGMEVLKPPYDDTQLPDAIDAARVGVSWASLGIAESGSLIEMTTNDADRLVSTLPRTHIALVRASDIRETLKEAAEPIRIFFEVHPRDASVTFISGPSRTADIEMRLTLGVHGPEVAHAVILKD